jgi:signal transduction histidine kinase
MDTPVDVPYRPADGATPARDGGSAGVWSTITRLTDAVTQPSDVVVDVAIAVVAALAVLVRISVAREVGARPVDAGALLLGLVFGALVLGRRRWPLATLIASLVTVSLYHWIGYPAIGIAVPLAVPLYSAAVSGHRDWSIVVSAWLVVSVFVWRAFFEHIDSVLAIANDVTQELLLVSALVLLGDSVRTRRALSASIRERMRVMAAEREQEAQRHMAEERLSIARDLHDVVTHAVTLIGVQADVAAELLKDGRPHDAGEALELIQAARREAMLELRTTVGLLRENAGRTARTPTAGLALLDDLVAAMGDSDLAVTVGVEGEVRQLPSMMDATAYRVVQESLTNVLRHTSCRSATVALRYEPHLLVATVTNPPCGAPPPDHARETDGHGINGMAERAVAVGGVLRAGPTADGGFAVTAELPLPERFP